MKYKVTLEIECSDVSAEEIMDTLSVDIPDSEDFTATVLIVENQP